MVAEINAFVYLYPWAFSALVAICSVVIGSQLSFWRTRQLARIKEFNEMADPIRAALRRELSDTRANASWVSGEQLTLMLEMSSYINRRRIQAAIAQYKEARADHIETGSYGESFYTRTDHVQQATTELLLVVARR